MFCNFELVMRLLFKLTNRFDLQPAKYTFRLEARIFAGSYDDFNANFSFMFKSVKNLSGHPTYLCSGMFWTFGGILRYIWGCIVFFKVLVKFQERFYDVINLEFDEVKNWMTRTKQPCTNLGYPLGGRSIVWCSKTFFFF